MQPMLGLDSWILGTADVALRADAAARTKISGEFRVGAGAAELVTAAGEGRAAGAIRRAGDSGAHV